MRAEEAFDIASGRIKPRGFWFNVRLTWICGRMNQEIKKAAELGEMGLFVDLRRPKTKKKYFPAIRSAYERLGYVITSIGQETFTISWKEKVNGHEQT